jgi:hypothetical protein
MTTQHVRVEGTSYQRGQQYGSQAAARVRRSVQAYQQAFAHFAGWDWDTVRREAARFEAPVGTLDDFRALLADHADYPNSICAHPDPAEHPREQGATIASVLMDLTARRLWLAAGHPCQVPHEPLDVVL